MIKNLLILALTLLLGVFSYQYFVKLDELKEQNEINNILYNSNETTVTYNTTRVITGNLVSKYTTYSTITPFDSVSYACEGCFLSDSIFNVGDYISTNDKLFLGSSISSQINGEVSEIQNSDDGIMVIIDSFDTLSVTFNISQQLYEYISIGQKVTAKYNDTYFDITISDISHKFDDNFNLEVYAIFNNTEDFIPNAKIEIIVETESYNDVLLLPTNVISSSDLGYFVNLIDQNNIIRTRYISIGASSDGMTMILGGVEDGDKVIVPE